MQFFEGKGESLICGFEEKMSGLKQTLLGAFRKKKIWTGCCVNEGKNPDGVNAQKWMIKRIGVSGSAQKDTWDGGYLDKKKAFSKTAENGKEGEKSPKDYSTGLERGLKGVLNATARLKSTFRQENKSMTGSKKWFNQK